MSPAEAPSVTLARAGRRTRRAASAGTCRPASRAAAYSRPRRAERRSGPGSSGCRRRRRSGAPRTRAPCARSSSRARREADRRRRRRAFPARSSSGRTPSRASAATKWALSIPLRSALRSASATASGTDLDPPDLAGARRQGKRDRPDAAEEVEYALVARQGRVLGGDPVEALGHLGVGLQEGGVGDREAKPDELLGEVLVPEDPGRALGAAARPLDDGVEVDRGLGEARRRGDEARLDLPGARPLADDEVSQHPERVRAGRRREFARPRAHSRTAIARCVVALGRQQAVLGVDHLGPASAAVEAEHEVAVALAERVLELVPIAPGARPRARSARGRSRRGRRGGEARPRPAAPSRRAGARTGAPARERRGTARRRGGSDRGRGRGSGRSARRTRASPKSRFASVEPRPDPVARQSPPETKTT